MQCVTPYPSSQKKEKEEAWLDFHNLHSYHESGPKKRWLDDDFYSGSEQAKGGHFGGQLTYLYSQTGPEYWRLYSVMYDVS